MSSFPPLLRNIYYTLYPRIFKTGAEATITLSDRFGLRELPDECLVHIIPVVQFENMHPLDELTVATRDGNLSFCYTFKQEQPYLIRLLDPERRGLSLEFAVYALDDDLFERRPYKGDLHLHTNRSDGLETPRHMVCACRQRGLDFLALTDHNRYEPSLEALEALSRLPHRMMALKGEEVHAGADTSSEARCPVHILSLDAEYALAPFKSFQTEEGFEAALKEIEEDFDRLAEEKPWLGHLGKERARHLLVNTKQRRKELLDEFEDPTGTIDAEAYTYALEVFESIRKAGGISVLCHTQWRFIPFDAFAKRDDVPLELTRKLIKDKPYDIYEAASYAPKEESSKNLMQLNLLAEAGHLGSTPLIGITDTHATLPGWNELGRIYTVLFSGELSAEGIRDALLNSFCVAVENYEGEDVRCHGSYRLALFTEFLVDHFYPMHDEHCQLEAALMYRFFDTEDESVARILSQLCQMHEHDEALWWWKGEQTSV